MWQKISIIVPVLNEAKTIEAFLQTLQLLRAQGHEVIVVDGRSEDNTYLLASSYVDHILCVDKGRAQQQIAGITQATGNIFLFLHADTLLPIDAALIILKALSDKKLNNALWGRFNVRLSGHFWFFRIIEQLMNWRSCLTGIATGDQAIFVTRSLYYKTGGMPAIELMEDIELSKRLSQFSQPLCLKSTVITSSRRWEQNGIAKTIFIMWMMRLQYFFGVSPKRLLKKYYPQ
jgi:rSAM/selenodomain-associated transferase 2